MPARPLRRLALAGAAGAAVLLAVPAAGAHVEAESASADGVTTVTFGFHHGCDGAATTSLRVQLPEGATDVEPQDPAGWTSEVSGGELAWTGGSIPDAQQGTFVVTMRLVDAEGSTVFLPTVQGCEGGAEEAWIDRSEDPEAAQAAPRITAGAVVSTGGHDGEVEGGHGAAPTTEAQKTTNAEGVGSTTAPSTAAAGHDETAAGATDHASSSSNAPLIIGIVAAVVVIGALIAFLVSRRGAAADRS